MHCISCTLKRKVKKTSVVQANSKVTFHVPGLSALQFWRQKITRPWRTILLGFAGSPSFFVPLPSRAISHTRGHLRISRFARRTTEKREAARSLGISLLIFKTKFDGNCFEHWTCRNSRGSILVLLKIKFCKVSHFVPKQICFMKFREDIWKSRTFLLAKEV